MAVFIATIISTRLVNGIRLEKGMSVELSSSNLEPLTTNGGKEVIEAFQEKYGVNIKKACAISSAYIEVIKSNKS